MSKVRVLVVDDMKTVRVQVSKVCKELGVTEVLEAKDGQDAWDVLKSNPPVDAIISDFNMPGLTGEDLLKKVKADPELKGIPFLFVTAESDKEKVLQFLLLGVVGYIVKPFSQHTLLEKLREIFKAHIKIPS